MKRNGVRFGFKSFAATVILVLSLQVCSSDWLVSMGTLKPMGTCTNGGSNSCCQYNVCLNYLRDETYLSQINGFNDWVVSIQSHNGIANPLLKNCYSTDGNNYMDFIALLSHAVGLGRVSGTTYVHASNLNDVSARLLKVFKTMMCSQMASPHYLHRALSFMPALGDGYGAIVQMQGRRCLVSSPCPDVNAFRTWTTFSASLWGIDQCTNGKKIMMGKIHDFFSVLNGPQFGASLSDVVTIAEQEPTPPGTPEFNNETIFDLLIDEVELYGAPVRVLGWVDNYGGFNNWQ